MATPRMDITSFVGKLLEQDDVDALREGVRVLAQAVMETEVSGQIGAAPYERSTERTAYRNGYRTRRWDTRVGTIELKIPKVTAGAYFPSLLEPRRRAEKALHAVVVLDQWPGQLRYACPGTSKTELDFQEQMRLLARISPEAAVMESYRRVDQELRDPLLLQLLPPVHRYGKTATTRAIIREAQQAELLRPGDLAVFDDLATLRNAVAHQAVDMDESMATAYADLAWRALKTFVARLRSEMKQPEDTARND